MYHNGDSAVCGHHCWQEVKCVWKIHTLETCSCSANQDIARLCWTRRNFIYVVHTMHLMSLKLCVITPTRAQLTNKRILVKVSVTTRHVSVLWGFRCSDLVLLIFFFNYNSVAQGAFIWIFKTSLAIHHRQSRNRGDITLTRAASGHQVILRFALRVVPQSTDTCRVLSDIFHYGSFICNLCASWCELYNFTEGTCSQQSSSCTCPEPGESIRSSCFTSCRYIIIPSLSRTVNWFSFEVFLNRCEKKY
jgi:hypothetical protein